jgi:aspartyl-tRNA(Asn)/glutamyl-tRNA(Gln) amidotransferase subunit C
MKEVERIINLSRINFTPQEKESLAKDLKEILGYVEKLKEVDVSLVEPLTQPIEINNVVRQDQPQDSENQEEIIDLFPEKEKRFLKVKSIF